MINALPRIHPLKWDPKFSEILRCKQITFSWPQDQNSWQFLKNKKEKLSNYGFLEDYIVNIQEKEKKKDKYIDLSRKLKKL